MFNGMRQKQRKVKKAGGHWESNPAESLAQTASGNEARFNMYVGIFDLIFLCIFILHTLTVPTRFCDTWLSGTAIPVKCISLVHYIVVALLWRVQEYKQRHSRHGSS